jgi:uncharacterized cupin superfamily protein
VLLAGMVAGFKAGDPNAHQLLNRSARPAVYLEVSNRDARDCARYPDVDLCADKDGEGRWQFSHKDGRPY